MAFLNGWRITRTGIVFVVGVIVLLGLVFGGIWLVRERGEQARRQEAIKLAEQNLQEQSQTPATETGDKPAAPAASESESGAQTQTASSGSASSSELPATGADLSHIVVLVLLTLSAAYYVTSRRLARQL
jgi:FtsZ-interacting cell division protein ZipA